MQCLTRKQALQVQVVKLCNAALPYTALAGDVIGGEEGNILGGEGGDMIGSE